MVIWLLTLCPVQVTLCQVLDSSYLCIQPTFIEQLPFARLSILRECYSKPWKFSNEQNESTYVLP